MKIVECVPNFSEGRDHNKIKIITDAISSVSGISLLDVDPGADTNRTVVTFVGEPDNVIEAAFQAIKTAASVLDMRLHHGAHARMGATDVCPFVPVANITMEECVLLSQRLAKRVGDELNIPVFLYENSASKPDRQNLANVRSGEYEGMAAKLKDPEWHPDFGPVVLDEKAGVTAIGAREFLVAYNVNLNTQSKAIASDIALDIREAGRRARNEKGKFISDEEGNPVMTLGKLKFVKAVGWYIDEYQIAQLSMNLTNYKITPVHSAFEESREQARLRGVRVTGSELVGLIPLQAILDAGIYYLQKQNRSIGIPTEDIIHIAVKSLGLDDLSPFDPKEKIIEYQIGHEFGSLATMSIDKFMDELSRESPAPGGGSVSALAGSLGAALAAMVSNLTTGKKKFRGVFDKMQTLGIQGQELKVRLLKLIDEDTNAFNEVMNAYRLPAGDKDETAKKEQAIEMANQHATNIPFQVVKACAEVMTLATQAASFGNPNSVSDAGVAGEMAHAGAHGAALNVIINLNSISDESFCNSMRQNTEQILQAVDNDLASLRQIVNGKLNN
ncbi:MAG: glutamate formimidoyltransferase [Candidatus Marinimicrobia bacterium]|nr:glutamate formimidoyltransferase [Candidatus Neomarinimicrobiota bacterium]